MRRIFKYPIPLPSLEPEHPGGAKIQMPKFSAVVSVGLDPQGVFCIWAEVDPDAIYGYDEREFVIAGTGHFVPEGGAHIGQVVQGPFVWHLYEVFR